MLKLTVADSLNNIKYYNLFMIQHFFVAFQTNHVKVK